MGIFSERHHQQPSTKTATRLLGSRKSGVQPNASLRCSRKRPPAAWTARRKRSSGDVLTALRPLRCPLLLVVIQPLADKIRHPQTLDAADHHFTQNPLLADRRHRWTT